MSSHLSSKLQVSRLQRDLSDSTAMRSLGSVFAYGQLAFLSLLKGLEKVSIDPQAINADLDSTWEVLAEAVQTLLRREGVKDAYDRLKKQRGVRGSAKNATVPVSRAKRAAW